MGTFVTLGAAFRMTGLSKKALSAAIRSGELAATRKDNWILQIDATELSRFQRSRRVGGPARRGTVQQPSGSSARVWSIIRRIITRPATALR